MPEEKYMRRAIELAKKGVGHVNPNPLVGAVIVRDGEILAEGYHEQYGKFHAERNAIEHARRDGIALTGSTIYVTLEPCCHHGHQPPCTDAIIEEKIAHVVVGSDDPNPLVSGKGFKILREHGIEVTPHFLKEECDAINDVFFYYISTKRPYVDLKYAMTMDGKIACHTGDSKWVTGEESRAYVQELRNRYKGIMVGIGTVLADNPTLNCRIEGGRDPIRIVCDDHLRIPLDCTLVRTAKEQPTIVATLPYEESQTSDQAEARDEKARIAKKEALMEAGVEVLEIPPKDGMVDLNRLMEELGSREIDGILLEGGGTLNESALSAGIVNHVDCFIAPKIFGGAKAKTPVEGQGLDLAKDAWMFEREDVRSFGDDLLISYRKK